MAGVTRPMSQMRKFETVSLFVRLFIIHLWKKLRNFAVVSVH